MNNDFITVYWAPEQPGWELLYEQPQSLFSLHRKKIAETAVDVSRSMFACPASSFVLKNTYVLKCPIDDVFDIPTDSLKELQDSEFVSKIYLPNTGNKLAVARPRPSVLSDYYEIEYNMHWLWFADEPVEVRFTSPFFPPSAPAKGAMLVPGEFNIGKWFRNFNLDYYIPKDTKQINFNKGDELAYIEFKTDKKIIFKRFKSTPEILEILQESSESPDRYGRSSSLNQRYEMGEKTQLRDRVLTEIKKTVIDSQQ